MFRGLDIDESAAADTAQRIIDNGGTAHGYRLDVREPQADSADHSPARPDVGIL